METFTTQPAVQLYTGNYLDNLAGKDGAVYNQHSTLCLETQNYPDAINHQSHSKGVTSNTVRLVWPIHKGRLNVAEARKLFLCTYVQVCGSKRLGCHISHQEVSRCCARVESEESIVCRWWSIQVRNSLWLWNPWQTSPEVQKRGISGLTKNFKKKKNLSAFKLFI